MRKLHHVLGVARRFLSLSSRPTAMAPQSPYRLPTDVKPTHYDLTIKTDLDALSFDGYTKIHLDVKNDTSEIVFNASHLTLANAALIDGDDIQPASSLQLSQDNERATAQFSSPLLAGTKALLGIRFSGKIDCSMLGYYASKYKEKDGSEKYYALTQFEPTCARRGFPSFDEPLLKATFSITMVSRNDTVNLSNMPVVSEEPYVSSKEEVIDDLFKPLAPNEAPAVTAIGEEEWKVTTFDKTPPVSTYLIAYANGPFQYKETSYVSPLSGKVRPLRVYATWDLIDQTEWGLDVKARILPVYEKIFDIEFPLPKLDTLVAHDFDAGAMENWGLITGRTNAYCMDPANENIKAKIRIATVQSHEVAHQWFGNIVTMAWWDNLWLNEGFATIMGEMIALNKIEPNWGLYDDFCINHVDEALTMDQKPSSHPIEVPLDNPDDVNQVFDSLSYAKAGSVLRMLSEHVGEEKFLKGVSIYLKKRLYGNSVTRDLWDGISEATGLDIASLMNNWILKIGYPVLTVTEAPDSITIRQDRFLEAGRPQPEDNETIWQVPLFLTTKEDDGSPALDRATILGEREAKFQLDTSKPFLVKGGNRGVYRVLYEPHRIQRIAEEATKDNTIVSLVDRTGLISDATALAKANLAPTSSALVLIDGFRWEKSYVGCAAIDAATSRIMNVFWEDDEIWNGIQEFRRGLFKPHVDRLGYEKQSGDTVDTIQLRSIAIAATASAGDKDVVEELLRRFNKYTETGDSSHVPTDIMSAAFQCAVKNGGEKEWEAMTKIFKAAETPQMKTAAMSALGFTQSEELFLRSIEFAKTDVSDGDVLYVWVGFGLNRTARRRIFDWTLENWDYIENRFALNFLQVQNIIKYTFMRLCKASDADKLVEFYKDKNTSKFTMPLAQCVDSIRAADGWHHNAKEDVKKWLRSRSLYQ